MSDTPRLGLRRPVGADNYLITSDLQNIVDTLDSAAIDQQGTLAARPAATAVKSGTYYFVTDSGDTYRSNGTAWAVVGSWASGDLKDSACPITAGAEPLGWLLCDGRSAGILRTTYAALFAAIGTDYGAGDGSTTFNLPDYRGRMRVGVGTHAEINALTDNDGLAVGSRKVKHRHGKGTIAASGGSHTHPPAAGSSFGYWQPGDTIAWPGAGAQKFVQYESAATGSASHSHPNGEFSGEVGDTAGPLDGPAYQTAHVLIKI